MWWSTGVEDCIMRRNVCYLTHYFLCWFSFFYNGRKELTELIDCRQCEWILLCEWHCDRHSWTPQVPSKVRELWLGRYKLSLVEFCTSISISTMVMVSKRHSISLIEYVLYPFLSFCSRSADIQLNCSILHYNCSCTCISNVARIIFIFEDTIDY